MPRYYGTKYNANIKMTSIYNKLCNKQDVLFSSSTSNLHKGQGSPNNLKRCTNHLISLNCVLYEIIYIFDLFLQRQ
jgi:hypothetical protein